MTATQIRNITFFVDDQDRALAFYTGTLGLVVRTDRTTEDNRWLEVGPGDGGTAIVLHRAFPGSAAGTTSGVIIESTDLDADADAVRAAGGTVDGPTDMPWGRQAVVADPDGNSFVLTAAQH